MYLFYVAEHTGKQRPFLCVYFHSAAVILQHISFGDEKKGKEPNFSTMAIVKIFLSLLEDFRRIFLCDDAEM